MSQILDVTLFPIGPTQLTSQEDASFLGGLVSKKQLFDGQSPCLKVWHEYDLAERIGSGPFFSFPFFEITKFCATRINHLKSCDGIIVASEWAADVVKKQIESCPPVHIVPLGVDTNIFNDSNFVKAEKCIFFNCAITTQFGSYIYMFV